jgi:hypothetical protein
MACEDCGEPEARFSLGGVEVCDRCFDRRIAEHTGFPRLPEPPPPLVLAGPDDRRHRLRFRIWRAPTGIEVELEEMDVPVGEGYKFAVLGEHDADVDHLVEHVQRQAEAEVGRLYLEPADHRDGWVVDDEVAGRFVWNDEEPRGTPYRVVVDGRTLSWEELGRALEPYEGWNFRLVIEDSIGDARPDAQIIELPRSGDG